jgi:hypothetical protein
VAATAPGTDWVSILTAIGTVCAVLAAVGIAGWSERQRRQERRVERGRAHLADAYAVQVVLMQSQEEPNHRHLKAIIINHGSRTIREVEARFSPDGKTLIPPDSLERLPGRSKLPEDVQAYAEHLEPVKAKEKKGSCGRLTPWDTGISFDWGPIAERDLTDPSVIVRWTDRSEVDWEYKGGDVQQVDGKPWAP